MTSRYFITGCWGSRDEDADQLAARFLKEIDLLQAISPFFDLWTCGAKRPKKFEDIRDHYAQEIALGITKGDYGEIEPENGFWFGGYTRGLPATHSFTLRIHAGSHRGDSTYENSAIFGNSSLLEAVPDPEAIAYPLFKAVLLSIVEAWEPTECHASCHDLLDRLRRPERSGHFRPVWIQYLNAPLARVITPPASAIVEYLPNGGLLMSATTETFDVNNREHFAAALDIAAATAPLNAL